MSIPRAWKNKFGVGEWTDAQYMAKWKAMSTVNPVTGCWEWQGYRMHFMSGRTPLPGNGYAQTGYRGGQVRVHRVVLAIKLGRPLGPRMQSCHTCDVPWCINPDHLYEGDNRRNHLDGGQRKRMQGQTKTACVQGHEFTPENTYVEQRGLGATSRACRECSRQAGYRRHHGLPKGAPVPPRKLPYQNRSSGLNQRLDHE